MLREMRGPALGWGSVCTAMGEMGPMGAGGALANVSFYPPEKPNTWIYTIYHFLQLLAVLPGWAQFHGYHQVVPRGVPGCSPWGGERLSVILPWQGHTAEHTLDLPMLLPQKLNYWPPTHLQQNFCPTQKFKVL